jgi:hypothetical protein
LARRKKSPRAAAKESSWSSRESREPAQIVFPGQIPNAKTPNAKKGSKLPVGQNPKIPNEIWDFFGIWTFGVWSFTQFALREALLPAFPVRIRSRLLVGLHLPEPRIVAEGIVLRFAEGVTVGEAGFAERAQHCDGLVFSAR